MSDFTRKLNTRHLEFPAQLLVEKNAIANTPLLSNLPLSQGVLLAIDDGVKTLAEQVLPHLWASKSCTTHVIEKADFTNVSQIDAICAERQIETVVAFGGGKVLDVCKRLASLRHIELIVIPTALSSDCVSSPIAVIFDESGKKLSLPAAIPNVIIVDTKLCSQAPRRLTQAGIGDLLSNYCALLDMNYAKDRADVDGFSYLLAKSAANEIVGMQHLSLTDQAVITQLAEGLILSGLAMGFSGDSRPCSGAEHLISHALDFLNLGDGLHGEQVALGMKFCHHLRLLLNLPALNPSVLACIDGFNIRSTPDSLNISKNEFFEALAISPEMRKGRMTFLEKQNSIPKAQLEKAYINAFE
ncbi:Glycerol dehydrogenase-like protein [Shewanella sediminis HAW-EB3]|uniref:Glycerol dehydrogenase-like protein n=1 Tax=Shewanella sediminis (strain HAW-EB3) TaxID=425104 RepID=A8FPF2_SHESH|nr:iron-containing alcohol dehydrogenase [Shewanella sediminis]ABV34725.1 Glycerol dehydrogenase-like protein [Shewanella sediminis HAW-EB3]